MSDTAEEEADERNVRSERPDPEHDAWFRKKVAEALDAKSDSEPYTPLDEAMRKLGW